MFRVKVSGMRLIAAHMMSRNHALILLDPVVTRHLNKFKRVIMSKHQLNHYVFNPKFS